MVLTGITTIVGRDLLIQSIDTQLSRVREDPEYLFEPSF